jgi:hypothetical protein
VEEALLRFAQFLGTLVEAAAVLVVAYGSFEAFFQLVRVIVVPKIITRFFSDLIGRLTGPLTLRLLLQPSVAMFFAVRDGLSDANKGRGPYFWSMFSEPKDVLMRRLCEGWRSVDLRSSLYARARC